jgi:hypothetical protein
MNQKRKNSHEFDPDDVKRTRLDLSDAEDDFLSESQYLNSNHPEDCDIDHNSRADIPSGTQTRSFFLHERLEALDPSLVQPRTQIEQENSILIVRDIGKQYELAVKDYQIKVRDNRIKAKDERIATLENDVQHKETIVGIYKGHSQYLAGLVEQQQSQLQQAEARRQYMSFELQQSHKQYEQAQHALSEQDNAIRILRNQLESARHEAQIIKYRSLKDYIIEWINSRLGYSNAARQKNHAVFPFMKLPGELRNKVYKHCLVLRRPFDLWPMIPLDAAPETEHVTLVDKDLRHINTALLRVSRQVYQEAVGLLYGCNRFRFSDRGGWTVLESFLSSIGRNYQHLTSISVQYPDWACHAFGDDRTVAHMEKEVSALLRRFGNAVLDAPNGPSSESFYAYLRAGKALMRMTNLKSFSVIVPHHVQIAEFSIEGMSKMLTMEDQWLSPGMRFSGKLCKPKRSFIFIRRAATQPPNIGLFMNTDNDSQMRRADLAVACGVDGPTIKGAEYGTSQDRVSYIVDGGEDQSDVEFPEYVEQVGPRGSLMQYCINAVKERMGYR